jgi:branched-chain amino acid transport system substrate-binding protein
MTGRRTFLTTTALGLLALAVLAPTDADAQEEPIRIGWLSSLTGPLSSAAIAENAGVQFAVNEINEGGGVLGRPLELLTRDTAGDPTKAVNFAQQLVFSDEVDFVIGPVNSGESLATVPMLARAGIPNLVIGTVDTLIDPSRYPLAFRVINTNEQWIEAANNYAVDTLGKTSVAVIGDTSGYGTSSAETATAMLEEKGVEPVYSALIDSNKTDLTDEMSKAQAAGADVVMPWSAATGLLARLLNTRGRMEWDVPVVGHPALMAQPVQPLLNQPQFWENAYGPGYRSTTYKPDGTLPERTQELMDALRPELGGKIDFTFWWVALGYDCVKIIQYAVEKAGSTEPEAIKEVLESTQGLEGVYATYTWSPDDHNGFPDGDIIMEVANSLREGSWEPAPMQ